MREALHGLTTRGRSFFAAAAAAGFAALILGEKDLLRVAVLLAILPLLAVFYVGRTRYKLACTRGLEPERVPVGATTRVVLRLQNLSNLPTGTLLLEDRLPYALGSRPRLVLERLGRQQASSVTYTVRADVRGRYEMGPLVVRLTDPFGLCELTRAFPTVDRLTVTPQVFPLSSAGLTGEYANAGESRALSVAVHGEDDAATREYRLGDDLRRVHWRSTARVGELMVRREEQPWESRATIVLDTRAAAHRGEGPTASFEWAVSAAASIATHLRRSGYLLRFVTDTGLDIPVADGTGDGALMDELADVRLSQRGGMTSLADRLRGGRDGGLLIGLFGLLTPEEAELVARLRRAGTTSIAFLIDSTTWLNLPTTTREQADRLHSASVLSLLHTGWRVIGVAQPATLAQLWSRAVRDSPGFTHRAAMAETVPGVARPVTG